MRHPSNKETYESAYLFIWWLGVHQGPRANEELFGKDLLPRRKHIFDKHESDGKIEPYVFSIHKVQNKGLKIYFERPKTILQRSWCIEIFNGKKEEREHQNS